ncbi:MAG: DUF433 domain-containing protein [Dehalococcoidia bacterium]
MVARTKQPKDGKTDHPHIVKTEGTVGGRPRIKGTRIGVHFIVGFINMGVGPEEILEMYPHLTPAGVYDAISYYYDHKEEVDKNIEENTFEKGLERNNLVMLESGQIVPKETLNQG